MRGRAGPPLPGEGVSTQVEDSKPYDSAEQQRPLSNGHANGLSSSAGPAAQPASGQEGNGAASSSGSGTESSSTESSRNGSTPGAQPQAPREDGVVLAQEHSGVPHRWRLVAMMMVAFVLCNMDKVNMSVAVIPMARDLGWTATDRGLVSSSFFWGYSLTQIPAGWISTRVGGAKVLMAGVALWSFGTLVAPPAAHLGLGALCASRVLVGLGEGFAPSAAVSVLARQVPSTERARAVTTVWGGLDIGSAVGLLLSGPLIRMFGWPSVFYLFAVLGGVWCLFWPMVKPEQLDPVVARQQAAEAAAAGTVPRVLRVPRPPSGGDAASSAGASEAIMDARSVAGSLDECEDEGGAPASGGGRAAAAAARAALRPKAGGANTAGGGSDMRLPWGEFMRSPPVWAVTVAHFCFNWGYYTLLAWLPSYFELALGLNVQNSSILTLIPYVAMTLMTPVVGPVADSLVKRGMSLTRVRKLCQGLAFVGPAICMLACALLTPATPAADTNTPLLVLLLSLGFALGAWSRAGLYCNHQDLSPKYASALLGITNTAGAIPGVLGVTSAGYLLDMTNSWTLALFLPTAACQLMGAVVYSIFASSERQPWS